MTSTAIDEHVPAPVIAPGPGADDALVRSRYEPGGPYDDPDGEPPAARGDAGGAAPGDGAAAPDEAGGGLTATAAPTADDPAADDPAAGRTADTAGQAVEDDGAGEPPLGDAGDPDADLEDDAEGPVRVRCPRCGATVTADGVPGHVPGHALPPETTNPFSVTVCPGSGADVPPGAVSDAGAAAPLLPRAGAEALELPPGLDWRRQPFSHARTA